METGICLKQGIRDMEGDRGRIYENLYRPRSFNGPIQGSLSLGVSCKSEPEHRAGCLFHRFDHHRSPVRQDFGYALHDLGRIVTRADNCITA